MASGVLFVHNNFPAQFRDLAQTMMRRGVPCAAIGSHTAAVLQDLMTGRYSTSRSSAPGIFPLAVRAEADMIRASDALRVARAIKARGFDPEIIIGHNGWGETLLLHEVWPDAKQVLFSEFFYHGRGLDIDFDTEFKAPTDDAILQGKTLNASMALSLTDADAIVCPTAFQASTLPPVFRSRVRIIHEGIDTDAIRPAPAQPLALPDGRILPVGAPLITHANNHMVPLRGLHIFARALPRLLADVPDAHVMIFGQETDRPYCGLPPDGRGWVETCFEGVTYDPARVHFMGKTPHQTMLAALQRSTAHVYYSYPFVLSWSLIEAMASGCYVIGSDTAPVRDAIEDGVNGRLLPFFDVEALSDALVEACRTPQSAAALRAAARDTAVARFARTKGRAAWLSLLDEMGLSIPPEPSRN